MAVKAKLRNLPSLQHRSSKKKPSSRPLTSTESEIKAKICQRRAFNLVTTKIRRSLLPLKHRPISTIVNINANYSKA